ncbi:hypothetical protein [uncultured Sphingomonas sp.]|uniref:hypothetical protein n=1 Tax=uncultured Sphingomonas sp. TaxID=158754 RepID=UPI0035CC5E2E
MPTAAALLALILLQAAPMPAPVPTPAPPPAVSPDVADERCLAAFAYLAGDPAQTSAVAQANRYGTLFFYGKLMGRNPGIDLGASLRTVANDIAAQMDAETARCRREVEAAGHAMAEAATTARSTPAR